MSLFRRPKLSQAMAPGFLRGGITLAAVILGLALLAPPAWSGPVITNGDFETNAAAFSTWPGYIGQGSNPPQIDGFSSTGGNVGINPISGPGGWGGTAPFRDNGADNTHVAFMQGNQTLTQTVSGFTPGKMYTLSFDYNARAWRQYGDNATQGLQVSLGSGSYTDNNVTAVGGNNPYHVGTFTFTADATSETLTLQSTATTDRTDLIDNLVVKAANSPQPTNPDFQLPDRGTNGGYNVSYVYNPTGAAWSFTGGSGVAGVGSDFNVANTPVGTQAGFLQDNGTISQTINGFAPGQYQLSFYAEGRPGYGGQQTINVQIDGTTVTFHGASTLSPAQSTHFVLYSSDIFKLSGGSHTLSFNGLNGSGDNTAFVNDVQLTATPEPASLTLLGMGALGLGGFAWRRRRAAASSRMAVK